MQKYVALLILVIPGILAGLGIKWMRDAVFGELVPQLQFIWLQFLLGLIFFVFGIIFIGGYILHREKKNKRAQEYFLKNENDDKDHKKS
ncbi:DUF2627 domain-containing protein [Mammaliicoccus stepanovicii]|uniref:Protein of uncharacterized function (DUF2627) n=1 Tax=Mammaliicoccus stepanovicii TaxID=643214 RepID=A0A239Z6I6_9STAP|nr:DUF2627 domain-containing protein [Mammaliicoccus stepanovicii]PNZ72716.1 DUF2627 domain-containing protein [Mammaliicoccus stepanovicii]GGI39948.1 hypothetical protein GCM10010896_05920 [Mammaliicoccus stepanovicii]SNV66889.1 Protein of uncharacterised function (DUF2627) [Mammaliicoccus stepanovicii]